MAGPPSKPPEDLAEVERALSVLAGRHPDHERLRREDEEKKAARVAEREATAKAENRRALFRRSLFAVGGLVITGAATVTFLSVRRELALRERMEHATSPFLPIGFAIVESTARGDKIEANVAAGCVLAVSTSGTAKLRLDRPGGSEEGLEPLLTCVCEGGHVTVSSPSKSDGLALLHVDAAALGGSRAFAFLPFKPGTRGKADLACEEASLDAWLDAKHAPETPAVDATRSDEWLASRPILKQAGFKLTATVKGDVPFATVDVPADSCVLAMSPDNVSLRLKGGTLAVGPAANVAWCTSTAAAVLAQHDGTSAVDVLVAPAERAGGLFGTIEAATLTRIAVGASALAPVDRGWSAKQTLLASAIPPALITTANAPDLGKDTEARIVALALDRPNSIQPDIGAEVFSFCDPPLATSTTPICVFSGPQKWRVDGSETSGGLARSKLPFWLFGLQGVNEPAALKLATQLVGFARKLHRQGFEPTTIEAITELDGGAEVLGRANEDAIVVLTVAPLAPWVVTYSDGPAWTLDDEPRIVPIKPLERVSVYANTKTLPPKASRRTVVFRHHI